jgi:cation diffusion facilitator family transporter
VSRHQARLGPDAHHDHHGPDHRHDHDGGGHGHSHGLVHSSITRSREGVRVVAISLAVLLITAVAQAAVFAASGSVALFADLVHNAGDALTALPLAAAFWMRSWTAERWAGFAVVMTILASGIISAIVAIDRLLHPRDVDDLWILAAAGLVGFLGNEIAAMIRLRGGRRLGSAALIADGHHARTDGLVSLGVVLSAAVVSVGLQLGDPIIGLVVTAVILRIAWHSFWTVLRAEAPVR